MTFSVGDRVKVISFCGSRASTVSGRLGKVLRLPESGTEGSIYFQVKLEGRGISRMPWYFTEEELELVEEANP